MWTLKEKLDYLEETKLQIKQAIIEKGIEVNDNDTFRSYVDKIKEITTLFKVPDGMSFAYSTINEIPMMDTSGVRNMNFLFNHCINITSCPSLDCSNATEMQQMFAGCDKLKVVHPLNTINVRDMQGTFSNCKLLSRIEELDFRNVETTTGIASNTPNLAYLNIKNLGMLPNVESYDFSSICNWGYDNIEPDSKNSLLSSLFNNSYDRNKIIAEGGKPVLIKLHENVRKLFSPEQIRIIESKGYIIENPQEVQ